MSWSVSSVGTREDVKKNAAEWFDTAAMNYKGTEEEKDIMTAKERALSVVDEIDLNTYTPDGQPMLVNVYCYGSRSTIDGKVSEASIHISVSRAQAMK